MENKKTAVDWLYDTIIIFPESVEDLAHNARSFKKAQQMEKEQIIDAHIHGDNEGCSKEFGYDTFGPEEYYKKNFGH